MQAFHMIVDEDGERARRIAKPHIEGYFRSLIDAGKDWSQGTTSTDYVDYDKRYERLKTMTMESMIANGSALVGTPAEVITSKTLTALYGAPVEVLTTSDGRLVVVGTPEAPAVHSDRHDGGSDAAG